MKGADDLLLPPSLLLHCCCAPCSAAIVEWLVAHDLRPVLFFSNANIFPRAEYEIRRDELLRHAARLGLDVLDDNDDHAAWLSAVRGLESAPERGPRCLECFRYRLLRAARQTADLGLAAFATTLASSRWKSLPQIDEAGEWAARQVGGPQFWARNWRRGGLQERRGELLREYGFYNQTYCGCEFSMRGRGGN